jgi:hypothetical protein
MYLHPTQQFKKMMVYKETLKPEVLGVLLKVVKHLKYEDLTLRPSTWSGRGNKKSQRWWLTYVIPTPATL